MKILIVDDHPIFRRGLKQVIEGEPRFELVGEAGDGGAALEIIRDRRPDIAVVDIDLPGVNGLELVRTLVVERIPTVVVILTMYKEELIFAEAMDLGVRGYILKDNAAEELVSGIKSVAAGECFVSPPMLKYLVRRRERAQALRASTPGLAGLTEAERRVLKLVARNKTSREIAEELSLSYHTVVTHRKNICQRLDLHGSNALLEFAIKHAGEL